MDSCSRSISTALDHEPWVNGTFFEPKQLHEEGNKCSQVNKDLIAPVENANTCNGSEPRVACSSDVEELGVVFDKFLQLEALNGQFCGCSMDKSRDDIYNNSFNHEKAYHDLQFSQLDMDNINTKKYLEKCETFSCSEERNLSVAAAESKLSMSMENQRPLNSEKAGLVSSDNASCPQTASLTPTVKLVSAMKGSREQQGQPLKEKLTVKWAPDVYDPPVTLTSHTVKSHQQRPRAKKKVSQKHKHKSKFYKGSSGEKKRTNYSSTFTAVSPHRRLQVPPGTLLDGFSGSPVMGIQDYTVDASESKCGRSFFLESLSKVHFPIAEAS